jgi:hypothetical protein
MLLSKKQGKEAKPDKVRLFSYGFAYSLNARLPGSLKDSSIFLGEIMGIRYDSGDEICF